MNNKGFTLIELLGVLLIVGVIATIITVTVDSSIKKSRVQSCQAQEKNIIEAAKVYLTDNPNLNTNGREISLTTLINGGYLENIKSPMTNEDYNSNTKVIVTYSSGYTYSVSYGDPKEECQN